MNKICSNVNLDPKAKVYMLYNVKYLMGEKKC